MLTTLSGPIDVDVARSWLDAPDVAELCLATESEPSFEDDMLALIEAETQRVSGDLAAAGVL